ncbi:L-asparaginase II [compost metagenome]
MASKQPLVVEVLRGPVVESLHQVMAVVVNENGGLTNYWGNPAFLTFPRSSIKMLQALPLIESGAADKFSLSDKQLALACSSHSGEKEHLSALMEWMEKTGIKESALACGGHWPRNEAAAHDMIRKGHKPTGICNNCSGKHMGILTTCLHLGEDLAGYEQYNHKAQLRLRKVLSEVTKTDHAKIVHGVDGCGIPTYALPLQAIAVGMSALINPKESATRKVAAERLMSAVRNQPLYLSGSGEFVTAVVEKSQGRAIIKNGAEGVYTGLIPAKGLAFAVKAADGAGRAAQVATSALLLALGGLSQDEFKALSDFTQPSVTNWKGDVVGQMRIAKAS